MVGDGFHLQVTPAEGENARGHHAMLSLAGSDR